jgi:BirA family biotin operon repressor/biotin-[acetyl-CoA-carboxylase] ligase
VVYWFDELPTTQDAVHRLAAEGAPHGTAVAARVQRDARGTRGRSWISRAGGLWLSVVCRPTAGSGIEVTGIRIGLALAEYLTILCEEAAAAGPPARLPLGLPVLLKWPNDLMLGEGKLGGILCEARWQGSRLGWIAAGVGLNVHNPLPDRTALPPARLADCGWRRSVEELAGPVADCVAGAARHAVPLDDRERAAFTARDWLRGRAVREPRPGVAMGITPGGNLLIRGDDGALVELADSSSLRVA